MTFEHSRSELTPDIFFSRDACHKRHFYVKFPLFLGSIYSYGTVDDVKKIGIFLAQFCKL